jgi:ParB family chromosome partitioning protein
MLPETVKAALMERKISERHARALLSLDSEELQLRVLEEILTKDLNVKQTEVRIAFLNESNKNKKAKRISFTKDVRLALNTIRQSIDMVSGSGLKIKTNEKDHEDHYEIVIQIPKR